MVYQYKLNIPLLYNNYDINEDIPSSEIIFVFKGNPKQYVFEDKIYTTNKENNSEWLKCNATIQLFVGNDNNCNEELCPLISCEIRGMIADSDEVAKKKAESFINRTLVSHMEI